MNLIVEAKEVGQFIFFFSYVASQFFEDSLLGS